MIGVSPSQATAVSPGSSSDVAQTRIQSDMRVARVNCRAIVGAAEAANGLSLRPQTFVGAPEDGGRGFRRSYSDFSRTSKRRSLRFAIPKRSSPCGKGL